MTVKDLIKKLKKMPKNLIIYTADHDHGTFETNSVAGCCEIVDKSEMDEYVNDKDCGLSNSFTDTPDRYVVVRP